MKLLSTFVVTSLIGLSLAHADGEKEARALFDAMESKIEAAKTIKVVYEAAPGWKGNEQLTQHGELLLGPNDEVHVVLEGADSQGQTSSMGITSDGKLGRMVRLEDGETKTGAVEELPRGYVSRMRGCLRRLSIPLGMLMSMTLNKGSTRYSMLDGKEIDPTEPVGTESTNAKLPVANFRMGEKEREEGRSLQVIEYDLTTGREEFHVKLWIDTTTGLPAKRVLTSPERKAPIQESYTSFELDPTFPAGTFSVDESNADEAPTSRPAK